MNKKITLMAVLLSLPLQLICISGRLYEDIPNKKPLPSEIYQTPAATKGSAMVTIDAQKQTITIDNQTNGTIRATFVGKKSAGKLKARQKSMLLKKGTNNIDTGFFVEQIILTLGYEEKYVNLNKYNAAITITETQNVIISE